MLRLRSTRNTKIPKIPHVSNKHFHMNSLKRLDRALVILLSLLLLAKMSSSWTCHTQLQPGSRKAFSVKKGMMPRIILPPFRNSRQPPTATGWSSMPMSPDDEIRDNIGEDDREEEEAWYENLDVLLEDDNELYGEDTEEDWIPDAEKAKGQRPRGSRDLIPAKEVLGDTYADNQKAWNDSKKKGASPYTEEEEEIIDAMGGKGKKEKSSSREIGFLGDSTLKDISTDYSVPVCYLADVLAMWGVPVPINVHDRLGDLVTGEQAFALVEAVNTLDIGYLNDRYSNQNMLQVCDSWEIDIKDAFQFAMKEGWSLPFGVRTNLRVEQEDELLRVFSTLYREPDDD